MDLRRITALEKCSLDRSFPFSLANFRRLASSTTVHSSSSAVDILRACDTVPAQHVFHYLMCLNESPLFPLNTSCVIVSRLTSDMTTSVCASILSYLNAHCIRNFESVSGPLLEEVLESSGRFTALTDLTEEMLWADVGVVAIEDYRQSLYELMGYTLEGACTES